MLSYRFSQSHDGIASLFLTTCFVHRGIFYRAAVAQNSTVHQPQYGHMYHVLLQSGENFQSFIMWQDEESLWTCDTESVLQEIVFLLGNEITET